MKITFQTTYEERLFNVLKDLVSRCDGEQGMRDDGSNIDTREANHLISEIEDVLSHSKYTKYQLSNAFDKVKNKINWKNPIKAIIPNNEIEITKEAIMYFTGSIAKVSDYSGSHSLIQADGYFLTIGA